MPRLPIGWYGVIGNHAQERWWDGTAWSDLFRTAGPRNSDPAHRQAPAGDVGPVKTWWAGILGRNSRAPLNHADVHQVSADVRRNPAMHHLGPDGDLPNVDAEDGAKWLIAELRREAQLDGSPLTDWEEWAVYAPLHALTDEMRPAYRRLNDRAVILFRRRIEMYREAGSSSILVRPGLRIPVIWEAHYAPVYLSELNWNISAIIQNVFFGNPGAGEKGPWFSG